MSSFEVPVSEVLTNVVKEEVCLVKPVRVPVTGCAGQ